VASSSAATANDLLWGSTPIKTFMRAYLRFGRTSAISARRTFLLLRVLCFHTSFEPLRVPGTGGTQAENRPTPLVGDRKFTSDPCITGALEA
jgi:hypothetical protein